MMLVCIKQHQATFQAQFMKKLSNTEADLKNALLATKRVFWLSHKYYFYQFYWFSEIKKPTNVLIRKRNGEFVKQ